METKNTSPTTVVCMADGFEFEAVTGQSLMVALRDTGFDVVASCDGNLACGTCHVHVAEEWYARLPPPGDDEKAMLECVPGASPCSRLSCQISVTAELAGLSVSVVR